jgi:hypothetical protein
MMKPEDVARIKPQVLALAAALRVAVAHSEALRASCRDIEGDHAQLVFWPLTLPDASRQMTEYSSWYERVGAFLDDAAAERR